jgi:hypothetical protein
MSKRLLFTPEVIDKLPDMITQYDTIDDLALAVGCKPTTLRVRCSALGISLSKYHTRNTKTNQPRMTRIPATVRPGIARAIRYQAALLGTVDEVLVGRLLTKIVDDDLFNAILDGDTTFEARHNDTVQSN